MALRAVIVRRAVSRQIAVVIRGIGQAGGCEGFQIRFALAIVCGVHGFSQRRIAKKGEQRDDCDYDEQFDQREAVNVARAS